MDGDSSGAGSGVSGQILRCTAERDAFKPNVKSRACVGAYCPKIRGNGGRQSCAFRSTRAIQKPFANESLPNDRNLSRSSKPPIKRGPCGHSLVEADLPQGFASRNAFTDFVPNFPCLDRRPTHPARFLQALLYGRIRYIRHLFRANCAAMGHQSQVALPAPRLQQTDCSPSPQKGTIRQFRLDRCAAPRCICDSHP